tara:strand:+ start:360 stop:599 length:240 start_codon:yes stop_codon:yes gene_type:complete
MDNQNTVFVGAGRVVVRFKDQYGRMVCHPVDEQAKVFAEIAGTKTLTYHTLKGIDYLGFKIATTLQTLNINEVREMLEQ